MGELFLKVLNLSLTASLLILAVICFRFLFRKAPKWVHCLLWSFVAIRLICPFSIESTLALLSGTEPIKDYAFVEGEIQYYIPSINSNLQIVENTVNPMLAESFAYEESDSVAPLQVVTYICGIVWVCGAILLMLYAAISLLRLHWRIREAVPYKDNIMICDAVKSPFILGNIRPRIYLSSGLNENEIEYIMAHESAHLKRGDHWWKPLGYLLLCVYWFNPLCWIAYTLFCKDIELACDEKVIRDMDIQDKKEYSKTLLSCAQQKEIVFACPLAFGEVGVKARVKNVLNYKKPAFWLIVIALLSCVIVAVCFLTSPKEQDLSFLNYENLVSVAAQSETLEVQHHLDGIENQVVGKDIGEFLDNANWKEKKYPSPLELSPDITICFDEIAELRFYESEPELAMILADGGWRYYRMKNTSYNDIEECIKSSSVPAVSGVDEPLYIEEDNKNIIDLLNTICSSPETSSNPDDYIKAHESECDMLLSNGDSTLRYCIAEFMKGNQTDLRGHIMALICEELLQSKGKTPLDAESASNGQEWFDTILAQGSNMVEPYLSPADHKIVFGEQNVKERVDETSGWIKEKINVEKYDVTQDGVPDYIITSLEYDPALVDDDSTQKERIEQQLQVGFIRVDVYEGNKNSEEPDRDKALWSQEYSRAHTGNGQLSIVHIDDKDWLLTSSFYIGQGFANLEYEIFSLNQNGEKNILDTQLAEFEITRKDSLDEYKKFQTSLSKYVEDGILIIACDIDLEEQFVRTKETPCVPRNYYDIVFTKFEEETSEFAPVEVPMAENRVPDISSVASIVVVNGNNGEELIFNKTDDNTEFNKLLELYGQLDFVADSEKNTRVGYQYRMKLQDTDGNIIQAVTPYKDGFTIDSTFYKYNGENPLDFSAVNLMNYIELLFYPIEDSTVNIIEDADTNSTKMGL